jgi:hypothetical protein
MVTAMNAEATREELGAWRSYQAERGADKDAAAAGLAASKGMPALLKDNYGPKATPMMADGVTPMSDEHKGVAAQAFSDIYTSAGGKVAAPEAVRRANGLIHGTMELKPTTTGYFAVIDKASGSPVGYVSADTAELIKGAVLPKPNAPSSQQTH